MNGRSRWLMTGGALLLRLLIVGVGLADFLLSDAY